MLYYLSDSCNFFFTYIFRVWILYLEKSSEGHFRSLLLMINVYLKSAAERNFPLKSTRNSMLYYLEKKYGIIFNTLRFSPNFRGIFT